jgi:MoxR-like ATPase
MPEFQRYRFYKERSAEQRAAERYLASRPLATAVNTAIAAEQPLLIMGEPGTGKTRLAPSIAQQLGLELQEFHTRSEHQARDVLYAFDNMRRFYDAQIKSDRVVDLNSYVTYGALGRAIASGKEQVVLIDEIDKASRDFPNDLLDVIDRMRFTVAETGKLHETRARPIVVITSNSERELPEPFLRRCVFHHIQFPDEEMLREILTTHFGSDLPAKLATTALRRFDELRRQPLDKKPATGELLTWVRVLLRDRGPKKKEEEKDLDECSLAELPHLGALLKTLRDLNTVSSGG